MVVKYRAPIGQEFKAKTGTDINGSFGWGNNGSFISYPVSQVIVSESHPVRFLGKVPGDLGGPFFSQKREVFIDAHELSISEAPGGFYRRWSQGVPFPSAGFMDLCRGTLTEVGLASACPPPVPASELDTFGTAAIAAVRPLDPRFEGATAAAELMSGVPSAPGFSGGGVGGEYLNLQFGVAPTASDFGKFHAAAQSNEDYLRKIARGSGAVSRKRFNPPAAVETSVTSQTGQYLTMAGTLTPTIYEQQAGTLTTTTTTSKEMWFSGGFTYLLPEDAVERKVAELDAIYGIRPGIDTAWNLVPFSWFVDWFTNHSQVLSNLNAFVQDGLVMPYAYVMCRQKHRVTYRLENSVNLFGTWTPQVTVGSVEYTTLQRKAATPYGFGVDVGSFSARQIATLAALGINRK